MKNLISILGSTGSIGRTTLKIIDKKKSHLTPYLFSGNKNYKLICSQIEKYHPKIFVINNYQIFKKIKIKFKKKKIEIFNNFSDIKRLKKSNTTISAIPGIAGLTPTIYMVKNSKKVLLANKESIICGWELIKKASILNKTKLVPIDSEHYSISKLLENNKVDQIKKIYITASGGPFLNYKLNEFRNISPRQALKHPKWKMGKKISIDSATLMNKLFELVEAQKIFEIPNHLLDIIIHPDSLVHAIVKLKNGLTIFLYHETSMIIPIANAIFDGNVNIENILSKNKMNIKTLVFKKVNSKIFPSFKLKNLINKYPSSPIIINACNEVLVDHFIQGKIAFLSIIKIIMMILKDHKYKKYAIRKTENIDQIIEIDMWAKLKTLKYIERINV